MLLLGELTTPPRDVVAAAGITVMLFAQYPFYVQAHRAGGRELSLGLFVAGRLIGGLAVLGVYRLIGVFT